MSSKTSSKTSTASATSTAAAKPQGQVKKNSNTKESSGTKSDNKPASSVPPAAAAPKPRSSLADDDLDAIFSKKPADGSATKTAGQKRKKEDEKSNKKGKTGEDGSAAPTEKDYESYDSEDEREFDDSGDEEEINEPQNAETLRRIKRRMAETSFRPGSKPPTDDFGFTRAGGNSGGISRTAEGFKIYKIDDLKMGGSKNTPLCPIDCDCCF